MLTLFGFLETFPDKIIVLLMKKIKKYILMLITDIETIITFTKQEHSVWLLKCFCEAN